MGKYLPDVVGIDGLNGDSASVMVLRTKNPRSQTESLFISPENVAFFAEFLFYWPYKPNSILVF